MCVGFIDMVLLRSEILSGMRAKLRTVAASNNRNRARNLSSRTLVIMFNRSHVNIGRAATSQSLLLLLARATHMMVLFFTHIPFVVNHTINGTPPERLQQSTAFAQSPRVHIRDFWNIILFCTYSVDWSTNLSFATPKTLYLNPIYCILLIKFAQKFVDL